MRREGLRLALTMLAQILPPMHARVLHRVLSTPRGCSTAAHVGKTLGRPPIWPFLCDLQRTRNPAWGCAPLTGLQLHVDRSCAHRPVPVLGADLGTSLR